jgi:hypothetical protein
MLLLWSQYNLSATVEGIFRFVWKLQLAEQQAWNDTASEANRLLKKPGKSSSIFVSFRLYPLTFEKYSEGVAGGTSLNGLREQESRLLLLTLHVCKSATVQPPSFRTIILCLYGK